MSEVNRFKIEFQPEGAFHECVYAADFDRVTAENSALQALLTAADERADVQSLALLEVVAACDLAMSAIDDDERGANFVQIIAAIKAKAALKPAEAPRNQCDGCQAGIPVENGAHRMGKPGGYPDLMGCTAKLYKPAEGGGDEA